MLPAPKYLLFLVAVACWTTPCIAGPFHNIWLDSPPGMVLPWRDPHACSTQESQTHWYVDGDLVFLRPQYSSNPAFAVVNGNGDDYANVVDRELRAGGHGVVSVAGNVIGLNQEGAANLRNRGNGVALVRSANNRVGTDGDGVSDELERNVISGNVWWGVILKDAESYGNVVAGNYIGTDVTGSYAVGNRVGVFLDGAPGKGGLAYVRHGALCLEAQGFPDAVHHPGFPSVLLPGRDIPPDDHLPLRGGVGSGLEREPYAQLASVLRARGPGPVGADGEDPALARGHRGQGEADLVRAVEGEP